MPVNNLTAIVPKRYRDSLDILEYSGLEDLEGKLRKLNENRNSAWFIEALLVYGAIWDSELYSESGLKWRDYKAQVGKRLGLDKNEFSDLFSAGKFLEKHGKKLFAAGFNPRRSNRKLARAWAALKVCGDADEVIDHLVNDEWIMFKAWYSGLKELAAPGEQKRKKRHIAIVEGRLYINGREPIRIAKSVTVKERLEIEALVVDYFKKKIK
jgi:hypothetical protein